MYLPTFHKERDQDTRLDRGRIGCLNLRMPHAACDTRYRSERGISSEISVENGRRVCLSLG